MYNNIDMYDINSSLLHKYIVYDIYGSIGDINLLQIDKFDVCNIYDIWSSCEVNFQFYLQNVQSLDSNNGIIGSFFLLKLFSRRGKRPFIIKLRCFQSFKKKYYLVLISLKLVNNYELNVFYNYFSLFLLPKLSDSDFKCKSVCNYIGSKLVNVVRRYVIYNLNSIKFVETNPIFYKWKENLIIDVVFFNKNVSYSNRLFKINMFLQFLKLLN